MGIVCKMQILFGHMLGHDGPVEDSALEVGTDIPSHQVRVKTVKTVYGQNMR